MRCGYVCHHSAQSAFVPPSSVRSVFHFASRLLGGVVTSPKPSAFASDANKLAKLMCLHGIEMCVFVFVFACAYLQVHGVTFCRLPMVRLNFLRACARSRRHTHADRVTLFPSSGKPRITCYIIVCVCDLLYPLAAGRMTGDVRPDSWPARIL